MIYSLVKGKLVKAILDGNLKNKILIIVVIKN